MRFGLLVAPLFLLGIALSLGADRDAQARPEFARREMKACGYCHINPRGGGPRNQNGLTFARNDFSFPPKKGNLTDFRAKDREAMVRIRKLLDVQHIPAAIRDLQKIQKRVKGVPRGVVEDVIHDMEVKSDEILGRARRLLRKAKHEEGIELLAFLAVEYKGMDVQKTALEDLKELEGESKEMRALVKKEMNEAKARRLLLDGLLRKADGKIVKAESVYRRVMKQYPDTRAAKRAEKELSGETEE